MTKAFVTGASGFVGSTLVERLLREGVSVRALLRPTSSRRYLEGLSFETITGDLEDPRALEKGIDGVDWVFHVAGIVSSPKVEDFYRYNSAGTQSVLDAIRAVHPPLKRLVYVSSIAASGPGASFEHPLLESMHSEPVSNYGQSKLKAEQLLLRCREEIPSVIARPPIVYGPRDPETFKVIETLNKGWMPLLGSRTQAKNRFYSSVHVSDLCEGLLQLAQSDLTLVPSGEIYYLSGNGTITYLEMMESIADALQVKTKVLPVPEAVLKMAGFVVPWVQRVLPWSLPLTRDKVQELLPRYWVCQNEKARSQLGFAPQRQFREGIRDAIGWYREKGWLKDASNKSTPH